LQDDVKNVAFWRNCRGRLGVLPLLVTGVVLFVVGIVQSVAALNINVSISRTMAAGAAPRNSMETGAARDLNIWETPWWAEAQDLFLLAWAKYRLASREPAETSAVLLMSATRDAERAVESAPGYSAAWLLLADLRHEAGASGSEVGKLLRISILTAPFDPYRVRGRLAIGFSVYPFLDDEGRDLLASQIQMAWRHIPDDLVKLAVTPDRVDRLFIIRLALATDASVLADFEKLLSRMK
jgi:hypothetical protein